MVRELDGLISGNRIVVDIGWERKMTEITLESLAARVEALEKRLAERLEPPAKDWRRVVGMFTGSEFMKQVDEACAAARDADREAAGQEDSE